MRYIPVGRALGAHGIKGEIKFRYYNEAEDDFLRYASLFLKSGDHYTRLELTDRRFRKGLIYLKFKGLESPEEVFPLVNKELFVREEDLPCLDEGEYYDYQLVGLDVVDRGLGPVGKVKAVVHTKENDILVVVTAGEEVFVPLREEFVLRIDLEGASIMIDADAIDS